MYEKYAAIRDEKGLSDYEVSKMSGVSTATLSCWKKGSYKPKVDKLQKIAKAIGCELEELL